MPHRLLGLVRMLRLDRGGLCHVLRSWYWPETHPALSGAAHACVSLQAERNRVKGTRGVFRQQTQGILGIPHSSPSALAHLSLDAICSFRRFTHRSLHARLHSLVPPITSRPRLQTQAQALLTATRGTHLVQVVEHSRHLLDSAHNFLRVIGIFLATWDTAVQCHLPAKRWGAFDLRGIRAPA